MTKCGLWGHDTISELESKYGGLTLRSKLRPCISRCQFGGMSCFGRPNE